MSFTSGENEFIERLTAASYRDVDEDFIRFRDDPLDDDVKSIVDAVCVADETQRDRFREALGPEEIETLRIYAKRRTLQSRRRSSKNLVDDSVAALALIPPADVPWDTWLKAALFIARSLGHDIAPIAERFGELSTIESAERFDVAFDAMNRVDDLSKCFIVEVTTNYGTGFIETLVHRDTKSLGAFYSAPRQADNVVPFAPQTNLAQLAASLADALDATEKLHTGAIAQDQLAGMSFSQQVSGAFLETTGCLSFYADSPVDEESFKVFVAELPDDVDVESLASGAELDDQAVCSIGARLVLYVAPPSFEDDEDGVFDFGDYINIARSTLQSTTPLGWHDR
ncbi:MAG TPA: hypothetical protein VMU68_14300 [Acidimicrobiales bacterium]|nr:hypothetical protein [Acidimicrobiales bacterium]